MSNIKYEVIFCIVNAGFTDAVMDTARANGARGGTVFHARGTSNPEAEKMFGIVIQPDKEIVMMVVDSAIKNTILNALYDSVGMNTPGGGIAFSMPVSDSVGIKVKNTEKKDKKENAHLNVEKTEESPKSTEEK